MDYHIKKGSLADFDTAYSIMRDYGQREYKDRVRLELLMSKEGYDVHFCFDDIGNLIGGAFTWTTNNYMWLDFIVVKDKYRRQGFGKAMLEYLYSISHNTKLGLFVEVYTPEGVDLKDEIVFYNFIKSSGANKLDIPYKLSVEFGEIGCYLFYMPSNHVRKLTGSTLVSVLIESLSKIDSNQYTIKDTLKFFKNNIPPKGIYYKKKKNSSIFRTLNTRQS